MSMLSIDFKKISQYAISAFTHVYGEEYESIISDKINNTKVIFYPNINFSFYISSIKACKNREFSIKFLEKIGIDVKDYKKENYADYFDKDVQKAMKIVKHYISLNGFDKNNYYKNIPLMNFNDDNICNDSSKIELINYLRGDQSNLVTKENIKEFIQTEEYIQILEKIKELNKIYEDLLLEYKEWEKQLFPYEKFIEYEEKRKNKVMQKHVEEFYNSIFIVLPSAVKDSLMNKTLSEQYQIILGKNDICLLSSNIECFSKKTTDKLCKSDIPLIEKLCIIRSQLRYFKDLGVELPNKQILDCKTEADVIAYLKFLNCEELKKFIPSSELVEYIINTRKIKYEDYYKELYMETEEFKNFIKGYEDNLEFVDHVYKIFKINSICISNVTPNYKNDIWTLFFTIRSGNCGSLFFSFMHELGHIIDSNFDRCGFEDLRNSETNKYDNNFRKYEKFNETFNDMFTIEAVELLEKQGIYFLEPKEFTLLDYSGCNTSKFNKNILKPLVAKFRKEVIRAKINADSEELILNIGKDNFEELVDIVNKVDDLSKNGLEYKLENEKDDPTVIEYYEQLERVRKVYKNIDNHYSEISLMNTIDDMIKKTI